jgi:hypothetical protein
MIEPDSDLRHKRRRQFCAAVRIAALDGALMGEPFEVILHDLSTSGLGFVHPEPMARGHRFQVIADHEMIARGPKPIRESAKSGTSPIDKSLRLVSIESSPTRYVPSFICNSCTGLANAWRRSGLPMRFYAKLFVICLVGFIGFLTSGYGYHLNRIRALTERPTSDHHATDEMHAAEADLGWDIMVATPATQPTTQPAQP